MLSLILGKIMEYMKSIFKIGWVEEWGYKQLRSFDFLRQETVEQLMAMIEVFHMQVNRSNCWYPKGGLVMTNRLVKLKAIVLPFQKL